VAAARAQAAAAAAGGGAVANAVPAAVVDVVPAVAQDVAPVIAANGVVANGAVADAAAAAPLGFEIEAPVQQSVASGFFGSAYNRVASTLSWAAGAAFDWMDSFTESG
jgi:hypothetical protein